VAYAAIKTRQVNVSELTDAALSYAIAIAAGMCVESRGSNAVTVWTEDALTGEKEVIILWQPWRNWAQGGPIIEREGIDLNFSACEGTSGEEWDAACEVNRVFGGPTPLIAAMRCYVASKVGDVVDIPEELFND
jgi:hypothetical protein